jgi:hypothetical protein
MLVVVALTVLLMSIVAEVFALASQTLTQLRAVSDANQKTRTVEAIIRRDLDNRTIREVQPPVERVLFGAGPDAIVGTADDDYYYRPLGTDPSKSLGYFTYSEGMPSDEQDEDIDDWIAFTVRLKAAGRIAGGAGATSAYYGRMLGPGVDGVYGNADDVIGTASSQEAEIIYFLRRGTLYRRVLLVGVPQPAGYVPARSWYEQFDFSARPPLVAGTVPIVNTMGDLTYRSARFGNRPPTAYSTGIGTTVPPIPPGLAADFTGDPVFATNAFSGGPLPGAPAFPGGPTGASGSSLEYNDANRNVRHDAGAAATPEHVDHNHNYPYAPNPSPLAVAEFFFGRPTLRETSAFNGALGTWDYPNNAASNVWDGFANAAGAKYFDTLSANATRPAEDVLMTNVLSFDIKAWDPDAIPDPARRPTAPQPVPPLNPADTTGAFVDLGKGADPAAADPSYLAIGPNPSSGTPFGPPGLSFSTATSTLPFFGLGQYPAAGTWPPQRPVSAPLAEPSYPATASPSGYFVPPGLVGFRRGFAYPFGTLLPDGTLNTSDFAIGPAPGLPFGMLRAPAALSRTYDTWCVAYTKPEQTWQDTIGSNGAPERGEPGMPMAPPYIVPLRGIQIKIRFVDPDTRLTREVTIVQELH